MIKIRSYCWLKSAFDFGFFQAYWSISCLHFEFKTCTLSKNHWRQVLRYRPHFNAKFVFSIQTWISCLIVKADLSQTCVSVQTRITVRHAFHLKRRSQPDSRLSSNADPSQTRVSSQTRIPARPASHPKRDLSQTRVSSQARIPARPASHRKRERSTRPAS